MALKRDAPELIRRIVEKLGREYDPQKTEEEVLGWWNTSRAYYKTRNKLLKRRKFY